MAFIRLTCETLTGTGQRGLNIWHANVESTNAAAAADLVADLDTFYTALGGYFGTSTVTTIGVSCTTVEDPPLIVPVTPQTAAGTVVTTTATPAQLAQVISWRTALAGRSYRGRTYIGPVVLGALSGSTFSTTVVTAAQAAADALVANSNGSTDYQLVVLSRFSGGVERPNPIGTPITSALVGNRVETQRRRNRP